MKIVILTGSPHKNGTSNTLVDEFIKGASEKGHLIKRYDIAFLDIHPCIGCDHYVE
ncbi:MAG: flavodoxin family protein [Thomasclavelia spiroformis]